MYNLNHFFPVVVMRPVRSAILWSYTRCWMGLIKVPSRLAFLIDWVFTMDWVMGTPTNTMKIAPPTAVCHNLCNGGPLTLFWYHDCWLAILLDSGDLYELFFRQDGRNADLVEIERHLFPLSAHSNTHYAYSFAFFLTCLLLRCNTHSGFHKQTY